MQVVWAKVVMFSHSCIACCERFDCQVQYTATDHGKLMTLVAGKRRSLFFTGDDDEVFMTRSLSTLRQRQQSSI